MKNILLISLALLVGCGSKTEVITGTNGTNGESCYAETVSGGTNIVCGDDVNFVSNGVDGSFDGYLEYRIVCEQIPGNYQETLLFLDGKYMAFLDGGTNDRLAILKEGVRYRTTDGRRVNFIITAGEIICLPRR